MVIRSSHFRPKRSFLLLFPEMPWATGSTLAMSPSGKLLEVAGAEGLEIFHFNGSSPITRYTGILNNHSFFPTTPTPGLMFWDNSNHLYVISPGGDQKLRVFTVTPTSATLVTGSPILGERSAKHHRPAHKLVARMTRAKIRLPGSLAA